MNPAAHVLDGGALTGHENGSKIMLNLTGSGNECTYEVVGTYTSVGTNSTAAIDGAFNAYCGYLYSFHGNFHVMKR